MAIDIALSSALSGLLTSQKALDVISNNLANINNPDYTRKVLREENRVVGGVGAGVQVGSVSRSVDESLNTSLRDANSQLSFLQSSDDFNAQLQNLFGTPGGASSVSHLLQNLANALQSQSATAGQSPSAAVQAAGQLCSNLQYLSNSIQSLRVKADQQIGTAVAAVNTNLQNISTLNNQIAVNSVAGVSTSDLEDQRDAAMNSLATYMDFVKFTRPDGTVSLYTSEGTALLDARPQTIVHTTSAAIQPQNAYSTVGQTALQGISVNGIDITTQISTGSIASLLQIRDATLPNLQSQIDTMAQTLQTSLNQVNNAGISYPNGGQSFTGTRTFIDPDQQKMSLSGGDTDILLLKSDGTEQARTTVSTLMASYQQANGLPTTNSYTVTQLSTAMNGWLNTQYQTSGMTYASVTTDGHFSVQLPQTSSTTIAFRDQHTVGFESSVTSDNLTSAAGGKSMGATGPLTFRDSKGNVYRYTVQGSDSLKDIADGLNALGGLTATLVPSGTTYQLQVANNAGYDMTIEPDPAGSTAVSKLGINPSRSQPSTNVTVGFDADQQGSTFTTSTFPSASTAMGVTGQLTFRDKTGVLGNVTVTPGTTLAGLATAINSAASLAGNKIHASLISVGNRQALSVVDLAGNQMRIDGSPSGYQSAAVPNAWTAAAGTISLSISGANYGPMTVGAGDTLQTIAATLNTKTASAGITTSVQTDGTNSWLSISSASGQPVSFSGSAVGTGAGQLNINPNARDALGLSAAPDQTVSGFANFLGLNDFLVTGQQHTVFDSQTLTTSFSTTAATTLELSDASWHNGDPTTGAPQSLNINIDAARTLGQIADQINAQAVTYDTNHGPIGSFKSAGGNIVVGSSLAQFASVAIAGNDSLNVVAQKLNADPTLSSLGIRAMVATDGTNEWLRVYDQQGTPLTFSGSAMGSASGQMTIGTNRMVTASVVSDGAGQRLRISHSDSTELQATGTLTDQIALAAAPVGTAQSLAVRSDIKANPSLLSHGQVQYNANLNQLFAGASDMSIVLAMSNAITNASSMPSAGGQGQGNYSLAQYSANIINSASTATASVRTQMTYQQTLVNNLTVQKGSVSGVNMDEELSSLISYQQSYSASAKVISTIQSLFAVLDNLIH